MSNMNQLPLILYSKLQQIDKFIIINAVTFFLNLKIDMLLVPCWIWERNNSIPHNIHSSFSGILNAYNGNLFKTVRQTNKALINQKLPDKDNLHR